MPEALQFGSGPCPLQKLVQPDLERGLGSAHLARDFVDAPLNRLPQSKIITMKGQDRLSANSVEYPLADLDLRPHDAAIFSVVLSLDVSLFDEVKPSQAVSA